MRHFLRHSTKWDILRHQRDIFKKFLMRHFYIVRHFEDWTNITKEIDLWSKTYYIIGGSPSPFWQLFIKKHLSKEYTCQVEVPTQLTGLWESLTFFLRARNVMRLVIHHPCFSGKNWRQSIEKKRVKNNLQSYQMVNAITIISVQK